MNSEVHLNEPFGYEIYQIVIKYNLKNNLEIGSWDGEGSTRCFVEAMKLLSYPLNLTCIELIDEKFDVLQNRYKNLEFVQPIHGSSISYKELIYKDFEKVWNSPFNKIKTYSKSLVKSWFDRDIEVLKKIDLGVISQLKEQMWDGVLIDGGEFTGYSEFLLLKNKTKVFFLDDVHTAFKCYEIYEELKKDSSKWELLSENSSIRNGFAVFLNKQIA